MNSDHTPITEAELKEMERVTDAATEGPWQVGYDGPSRPMLLTADTTQGQRMLSISGYGAYRSSGWGSYENEEADHAFAAMARSEMVRLIAEVRRLREALTSYAEVSNWWHEQPLGEPMASGRRHVLWEHPHPDYRNAPGYKLAREALGWGPPAEPCENPSCDGVKTFGDTHRCFKDGRWLDANEEM